MGAVDESGHNRRSVAGRMGSDSHLFVTSGRANDRHLNVRSMNQRGLWAPCERCGILSTGLLPAEHGGEMTTHLHQAVPPSAEPQDLPVSRLARISAPSSAAVTGREGGRLDRTTDAVIRSRPGLGSGLPESARSRMEAAFGASLQHVRVHGDPAAGTINDAVAAQAFTVGNDIFLGRHVAPATPRGDHVLAHEIPMC